MTRQSITLKDVARLAGVSAYSASRALNAQSGVSEVTSARVHEAAAALNYIPNRLAASLRRKDSHTIGVVTTNAANGYYATLISGIESAVSRRGFLTVTSDVLDGGSFSAERQETFARALIELRVAGVVMTYRPRADHLKLLADWQIPVVFVDCTPPDGFEQYSFAMNEDRALAKQVGEHLAGHGYRHWLFVGHPSSWPTRVERQRGFEDAANECGARVDVIEGGHTAQMAHDAVLKYLEGPRSDGVRAMFCSNEFLLNGTLRALKSRRIGVPDDVAVIGYDEFDWSELHDPPITTVDQHVRSLGELAGECLAAQIENADSAHGGPIPTTPATLLVRQSCGCVPK